VMTRMISENPFTTRGHAPIASREGMIFSDIRLDVKLVRREKNAHLFRPDLSEFAPAVDSETLAELSGATAFFRLTYLSSKPVRDLRHLTFMPHLAAAYADLSQGVVVHDPIQNATWTTSGLHLWLESTRNLESAAAHVSVRWEPDGTTGRFSTHGLRKIGFSEIASAPLESDQRTVVESLMQLLVREVWKLSDQAVAGLPAVMKLTTEFNQYVVKLSPGREFADARFEKEVA